VSGGRPSSCRRKPARRRGQKPRDKEAKSSPQNQTQKRPASSGRFALEHRRPGARAPRLWRRPNHSLHVGAWCSF
jgi:hypothetical protein